MSDELHSPSKRIYLDVCALCRPFDDQQQVRIHLETSAVALILTTVRQTDLTLIVSSVHQAEIGAIPEFEEHQQLLLLLEQVDTLFQFDQTPLRQQATQWVAQGVGLADAAHLAFANAAQADFVTVDDRLLKQCKRLNLAIWCGTPPAYCEKENLR